MAIISVLFAAVAAFTMTYGQPDLGGSRTNLNAGTQPVAVDPAIIRQRGAESRITPGVVDARTVNPVNTNNNLRPVNGLNPGINNQNPVNSNLNPVNIVSNPRLNNGITPNVVGTPQQPRIPVNQPINQPINQVPFNNGIQPIIGGNPGLVNPNIVNPNINLVNPGIGPGIPPNPVNIVTPVAPVVNPIGVTPVNGLINGGINAGIGGVGAGLINNGIIGGIGGGFGFANGGIGGGNALNNGIAQLLVGTFEWTGQDGNLYYMYICPGLGGDRYLYASVQRFAVNAFGLPPNTQQFAYIVARGSLHIGGDGAIVSFRGFRVFNAFGLDDDFFMQLVFSRCDNIFQLEIFDETYQLTKISNAIPLQQQCFRPSFVNTFATMPQLSAFQSLGNLPFRWRNGLNGPFNQIYTFRRQALQNNAFNLFSCSGFQNPLTNTFLPGYRRYWGNHGPYGHLAWNNGLFINAFDDDLFDGGLFDDDLFGCHRGIEFNFFTDDGDLFCNYQCYNQPTLGFAGLMRPISPLPNFGLQQCPVPNYGNINPGFFPGFQPLNVGLLGALNPGAAALAGGVGVAGGVAVVGL